MTTLMWFLPMNNLLAFQSLINARNAALVVLLAVACQRLANRRRTRLTPELARLAALKR